MVCRKWHFLCKEYNIYANHSCVGTWCKSDFCTESGHKVNECDNISQFFLPLDKNLSEKTFKGKYELNKDKLREVLAKCAKVKALVLKFARISDIETLDVIANHCPQLEHLDLSHTWTKPETMFRLNSFIASVGHNLTHLNLLGFDKITENQLRVFMYGCPNIEHLIIGIGSDNLASIGDQPSKGQFLALVGDRIKKVHIYFKYDDASCIEENNFGANSLNALAKGNGRFIEELKINGVLSSNWIEIISKNFKQLKTFSIGGFFIDLRIESNYQEMGAIIARLTNLENLIIRFPENISFEVGLLDIIRGCRKMKSLQIYGTPISDSLIIQLPHYCPNLSKLCLYYMRRSVAPNPRILPTDHCLPFVAQLRNLEHLALHCCEVTDDGLLDVITACPQLSVIDVRNCTLVTQTLVNICAQLASVRSKSLVKLYIFGTNIRDENIGNVTSNFHLSRQRFIYVDEESLAYNCDGLFVPNLYDN
ncbi:F-box/LRR-repeat protein 2-like protein [Dinothrombium tinctorium]|uniref:F-box/LRR-repeat protein 2-like protein n=1 Tax=Dinothrombium tinctorium TaxID=1965070 RepID=A0A3S3PFD9_9ACAR|nr:F-box/LRR-repeat protein 2-like protein [Dinothrombium tinctorium]